MGVADHVESIIEAWRAERPDLDVSPVGVFGRISRIERHNDLSLRPLFLRHRIDSGEYDVLAALRRSGEPCCLTPTQLYRSVIVTSATMTERLDRLERHKLVPDADRRRQTADQSSWRTHTQGRRALR